MRKLQNVTLEITTKCNFNCRHCCNDSGVKQDNNLTKIEIFNIIDQMKLMGVERLGITGGEPLCDINLFDYLEYAKGKIPVITIATNGYLLNQEVVNKLNQSGVNKIAISLDGTKEYHDWFRGKDGAYERVIKAIKLCVEAGMEVRIKSILTKYNGDSILSLMEVTNDLGLKRHEILPVCPIGRAEKALALTSGEYEEFLKKALTKLREMNDVKIAFQLKPVFHQDNLFEGVDEKSKQKSLTYICDALDTALEICANGDVIPCSFLRKPLANIRESKLENIWNDKRTVIIHNEIMNHNKVGECEQCQDNDKCNGGCYAHKVYGDGMDKKDIYCFVKRRNERCSIK